uniref:Uncharacterized protein n=1 Tax=Tanacetum cinerariifolium TaxID=118510 RepID=A0A6L2KAB7_TANCI|nr:hypothetical protein [Tanacetum cinerariifolium]
MDLFNLIRASNPTKVKTGTRPHVAYEVSLLTVTASRVIEMEDPAMATDSFGVPSTIERSPLDFANENLSQQSTGGNRTEDEGLAEENVAIGPCVIKECHKRGNDGVDMNAPPKVLRRDLAEFQPTQSTIGGKSLAAMEIGMGSTCPAPTSQDIPVDEIQNRSIPHLPPWSGHPKVFISRSEQVSTLQAQVTEEEKLKAAFEEFKQYEDNWVEERCAEIDACLDTLSIDFDEELYPHMLTAIAGRRWVIGHGLRLAVMKCGKSTKLRHVFADVVSAGIAKGFKVSHGGSVGEFEGWLIDVIMASLHLESYTGDDAPQWIRKIHHSCSQLMIPVITKVRDPNDPWACKEEILLVDAIATNISHAEKKKKCRVVCRTHGVGSAHYARSDGVSVSVSTVGLKGLTILLTDAATQMEASEDGASPRLLRSSSLPAMYNLD